MKYLFILKIVVVLAISHSICADQLLTIFFNRYPTPIFDITTNSLTTTLNHPQTMAASTLHNITKEHPLSGIIGTYAGFLSTSDSNGQLAFPLRHDATSIYIAITTLITPIIMISNTINHWQFEIGTPAELYFIERKVDPETAITYWNTEKRPIPENNQIPLEAMIIFAHPGDIYVPTGITPIKQTPHFVLPDVYIKRYKNRDEQALYVLNIRLFFGPILKLYQKNPTSLIEHISP